jgi:hypothetical protein
LSGFCRTVDRGAGFAVGDPQMYRSVIPRHRSGLVKNRREDPAKAEKFFSKRLFAVDQNHATGSMPLRLRPFSILDTATLRNETNHYFFCGLCVFAGDIPSLIAALPHGSVR